jgi:hypothetical protein
VDASSRSTTVPGPLRQLSEGPVFIVGMVRSGTTWAYDILTSHPEVAGALETALFNPMRGLPVLMASYHWEPNLGDAPSSGLQELMRRDEVVADLRELAAGWLARPLEPPHRFLVEKTPTHAYAMAEIGEVFPEARFIHVLRDGRDVAVSVLAASRAWAPVTWREHYATRFEDVGREWQIRVRAVRRAGRDLGPRFLEIRYEEMKADPAASARRLFDFCDIPHDEGQVSRAVDVTDFERNYDGGETSFRRRGLVGQWTERFSLRDAALFSRAAGQALVETGYERSRWWWLRRRARQR